MANICVNCKAGLREGAKFCHICGSKVLVKEKSKIAQAKFCIKCGAPLTKGAKFCMKCGAAIVQWQKADLNIYVDEPVVSVTVSDQPPVEDIMEKPPIGDIIHQPQADKRVSQRPPIIEEAPAEGTKTRQTPRTRSPYTDMDIEKEKKAKETKNHVEDKINKQMAALGKKALTQLLNQTISASDTAGKMRIPMNDAQKSCLSDAIRQLTKMMRG